MLLFVLTVSSGCLRGASKPKSNSATNQNTDYRVQPITGNFIEENKNNIWTFPTQKTYEFRACLIGRATNAQLPQGQKFMIIEPNGTAYESFTDDLGCLNWKESVDFNFASNSVYLKKSRRLRSLGSYKGEVQVDLAINPWLSYRNDPGLEVIDLSRTTIAADQMVNESDEELLRRGFVNNDDSAAQIILDPKLDFDLIPVRDIENGKTLQMVLRMKPYIEPRSLRGAPEPFKLTTGKFRVFAQLVSTNVGPDAKQHTLLTPEVLPQDVEVTNSGVLSLTLNFNLIREIHMGRIQLALKLEALSTPYPLQAYEGLHNIGSFRSILETGSATQVQGNFSNDNFSYGHFISTATNFETLKAQGFARNLHPVYYDYFDPRFVRIKSGETSTQRTLMYRVTTIVKDSITGEPVVLQPFRIKKIESDTEETQSTDENGRLIWNDELSHLYYKPEQYFFPKFEITQMVSGYKFSQTIAVNPWDFGWTFGVDTRGQEAYYQELSQRAVNPPEFMIDAFRYQTIRFRYVIDEYLTLNVKKAVVMALDPLVERNTINEGRRFEPLRNGIYLVKIALVKYYLDPFQNNTKLVKIDPNKPNGSINCPIAEEDPTSAVILPQDSVDLSTDYPTDEPELVNEKEPEVGYRLETVSCNGEAVKGQYTTVIKKLLRVQAGRITTPLEFSMRDLRMMSIRSNIMVQLETIDEKKLLRDNIADARLNQLVEEYYAVRTEDMTPEEKEAFLREKIAENAAQAEELQRVLRIQLEEIESERERLNLAYVERDRILSELETRLGSAEVAKSSETYKATLNLPEDEFLKRVNEARTQLNGLHSRVENFWVDYEKSWREGQLQTQEDQGLLPIPLEQLSKKPSYYDYLASMQTFLDDFDLGLQITDADRQVLEINNYSNTPLTPLVDLNLYRENSGLETRTFIGPCTLVANDNMSEMRPTDKIDEAATGRIDNSQEIYVPLIPPADNREFEESAYHDSLIPFKDLHVDDIIPMHIQNEKQYEREMKVMSQMGRYVRAFNLEYVSLTDQALKEFRPGCNLEDPNADCFDTQKENVTAKIPFLNSLNKVEDTLLLARYFYVRPPNRARRLSEVISRENTLEPLWSRTKRELFGFLPAEDDRWVSGSPFYYEAPLANSPWKNQALAFLEENYSNYSPKVNETHVKQWLSSGAQNLTLMESLKICSVLTDQISSLLRSQKIITDRSSIWSKAKKTPEEYLLEYCFSRIHHIDKDTISEEVLKLNNQVQFNNKPIDRVFIDGITFDRRRRIVRTGAYEHKAGKNTNLNVGVSFDVGSYKDTNTMASLGLNGGALIGTPVAGVGAAVGAAVGGPLGAAVGAGLGFAAGLVIGQESYSKGYGVSLSASTNVSLATFLVVQKAEEDITLEEYEKCLSFQFTPEAIKEMLVHEHHLQLSEGVDSKHLGLREALSRGYFICEGEVTKEPVKVRENYYYVTQHFTAGDMLDDVNLLNHVWLLALRGERDFNTFIRTMQGREIGPEGEVIEQDRLYDYSLSRLSLVYGKILPTFPGMYSIQDPLPIHTGQPRGRGF